MAIQAVPFALQNASHSAALFRQSASAAFASGGILAVGELALTQQGTPNMSVVLGAGRAKIVGNSVSPPSGLSFTTQAMYDTLNDAPLTLTLTASNATNPRIDASWVQVQDSFYSGAANTAVAGITAGVPAATPTAPAIPTNAILIGYIAVGANVTTIVTANISSQVSLARLIQSTLALEQHGAAGGVALTASVLTTVATINLPANAPAGSYMVFYSITTGSGSIAVHYQRVTFAGVEITAYTNDYLNNVPANTDVSKSDQILKIGHPGGAAAILLQTQVNAASAAMRFCRLNVLYVGP